MRLHPLNMDSPSTLEHMPEETRYNVGLTRFPLKIHDMLEVGLVFGLVSCSSESDINMFTSDPTRQSYL